MYEYTWYQWLTFFFLYSLIGWIFESVYVSLQKRQFVNRGFLVLPLTVNIVCAAAVSVLSAIDSAESVRAALDLAKVLDAMTNIRAAVRKEDTAERHCREHSGTDGRSGGRHRR